MDFAGPVQTGHLIVQMTRQEHPAEDLLVSFPEKRWLLRVHLLRSLLAKSSIRRVTHWRLLMLSCELGCKRFFAGQIQDSWPMQWLFSVAQKAAAGPQILPPAVSDHPAPTRTRHCTRLEEQPGALFLNLEKRR